MTMAQDQRSHSIKEQAYNIIKIKDSRTQRQSKINKYKKARFKISPHEFEDHTLREIDSLKYVYEYGSSESAGSLASRKIVGLKIKNTYVPIFKVRLYNVVGAREYELPTGDMLDGYSKDLKLTGGVGSSFAEKRRSRYMYSHYLDALAICCVHCNHSFFITFTCNVKWPELTKYMAAFPQLTATDRADVVDKVFKMKIHQSIKYLRDAQPFGKIVAVLYIVEFQKKGLLHCHTLVWIDQPT
nr:DNA helicase [Tanacetum cinerariifolium]